MGSKVLWKAASLAVASVCLAVLSSHGNAQVSLDDRYRQALDTLIADVSEPQNSFDFVRIAVDIGDLRGAVAALERILLLDPRLANIQLELGVLYIQMGNPELGRYHVSQALRAPNVPESVRTRAERYMATAATPARRHYLRGQVSFGFRGDDNANAGPDARDIDIFDPFVGDYVIGELDPAALGQSDTATEIAASLQHSFAFTTRPGSAWGTNLQVYSSRYAEFTGLDLLSTRLQTGPSLGIGSSPATALSIRPYLSAGKLWLDGDGYADHVGGGFELQRAYANRSTTRLRLQYMDQDFRSPGGRDLSGRSGDYSLLDVSQTWLIRRVQIGVQGGMEEASAASDIWSYRRAGAGLSLRLFGRQSSPRPPWSVFASATLRRTTYDAPDLLFSPDPRKDTRSDIRAGVDLPLARRLSLAIAGFTTDNDSNLRNFDYENTGGSLTFVVWF